MSRNRRQHRADDERTAARRIEPRFGDSRPAPEPQAASTAAQPFDNAALGNPTMLRWRPPASSAPRVSPVSASPISTAPKPEPPAQPGPDEPEPPHPFPGARDSQWSRIHVPDTERARAAKAGLYRYVKEAPADPRPQQTAPRHAPSPAGSDGKPRIWLTVALLLLLFGAGAAGLNWLAGPAPSPARQNAEWQTPPAAESPTPPVLSPRPAPIEVSPAPQGATPPQPRFIEVAP